MNRHFFTLSLAVAFLAGCGEAPSPASQQQGSASPIAAAPAAAQPGTVALTDDFPASFAALPKKPGGACGFDKPVSEGERRFLSGWALVSATDNALPEAVVVGIKSGSAERFALAARQPREDVVQYFKSAALKDSGFAVYLKAADVPAGSTATVYQVFQGTVYPCSPTAAL